MGFRWNDKSRDHERRIRGKRAELSRAPGLRRGRPEPGPDTEDAGGAGVAQDELARERRWSRAERMRDWLSVMIMRQEPGLRRYLKREPWEPRIRRDQRMSGHRMIPVIPRRRRRGMRKDPTWRGLEKSLREEAKGMRGQERADFERVYLNEGTEPESRTFEAAIRKAGGRSVKVPSAYPDVVDWHEQDPT